ncbi:MAG: hypothetical protein AB7H70_05570 [Rhodospirillaceae bacterium]
MSRDIRATLRDIFEISLMGQEVSTPVDKRHGAPLRQRAQARGAAQAGFMGWAENCEKAFARDGALLQREHGRDVRVAEGSWSG